jgi:uroporphyrinogen-III synthase
MSHDVLAACVGPVTAAPLTSMGIPVIRPDRFRLGALVKEIAEQLPQRTTRTVTLTGRTMEIRGQAVLLDDTLIPIGGSGIVFLRKLAEHPGRVVPRTELRQSLPGSGADGQAVEAAIGRLRAQLDDPTLIQTVVKRGYRLAS